MSKIISHRGANKYAPQNTIPAFQKAVELGAHGVENDVHLTRDGVVVVCHDHTIDSTSNGTGSINDYTYEELLQFDFGSYFSPEFAGTKIPTLAEFLDVCRPMEIINVEIKSPREKNTPIVQKTLETVKEFGLLEQLLVSSFDSDILLECKRLEPRCKTGMLYSIDENECPHLAELTDDYVAFAQKIDAQALHPVLLFIDEEYVANCHKAGLAVNPWTVNTEHTVKGFGALHCDGLITDVPDLALQWLQEI